VKQRGDPSAAPKPSNVDPPFHDVIKPAVKEKIQSRGLDLNLKSTVDIALGGARVKLGQGGYAGYAHADGMIAEGSYDCNEDGLVAFSWKRCLKFIGGKWELGDLSSLPSAMSLQDGKSKFNERKSCHALPDRKSSLTSARCSTFAPESVTLVKAGETVDDLWGSDKTDPSESFVEHGFLMRRVVLTRPPRARKPSRDK
jgi:hypothetical protein